MERVRAEARHAAEVQGVVQIRRRKDQLARQVLLVVLQHQGNGADVHAVLEQVALQVLQALEVLVELTRLTVAHEDRSEEHTSELQSRLHLVCRLLLEKKKKKNKMMNL